MVITSMVITYKPVIICNHQFLLPIGINHCNHAMELQSYDYSMIVVPTGFMQPTSRHD